MRLFDIALAEGLISSQPIERVVDVVKRKWPTVRVHEDATSPLYVLFFRGDDVLVPSFVQTFARMISTMGWYVASYYLNKGPVRRLNLADVTPDTLVGFLIEAKYDKQIEDVPPVLYHVAPSEYADKILRIGLSPRSQGKRSDHPDRVYLATDEESVFDIADTFFKDRQHSQTIFSIDTSKLVAGTRFFRDPNYTIDGVVYGYYTMDNIPPAALEVIAERDVDTN